MEPQKNKDVNINLIEYKVDELQKGQTRVESKVDLLTTQIDKMIFATPKDVQNLKDYVDKTFIKRESISGIKAVGYSVGTALVVAIVFAIAHLLGAKI